MGLKYSQDFGQEVTKDILWDIEECYVYLDDIDAFSDSWENHLFLQEFLPDSMRASSALTLSNVNRPFKKLIVFAIGSHPSDQNYALNVKWFWQWIEQRIQSISEAS